ncbi:DUF6249 domain-containing protein [Persicobacter psychrovividus]|uniref:DUF6249 domain-containing protein n=1 Tax=Persicobacter psychrovividus TaxID=387638 RepID=A0ABN6L4Z9_9BACT|nr:hypothetical protein PEPS_04580 [Persicobacter psychrovividus]
MNHIVEMVVPLGAFIMIFSVIYVVVTARNRERLAMIEKGMRPGNDLGSENVVGTSMKSSGTKSLRFGLLAMGAGIGLLLGILFQNWLEVAMNIRNGAAGVFIMLFIFVGLSQVLYYFIERKLIEKEEEKQKDRAVEVLD